VRVAGHVGEETGDSGVQSGELCFLGSLFVGVRVEPAQAHRVHGGGHARFHASRDEVELLLQVWLCQVCVAPSEAGIAGLSGSTLRLTGQLLSGLSGPT